MFYYIQTLGCQMNYSDSERVASILEKIGYKKTLKPKETDLYIFNTCSIRQKGEDRVFGYMKTISSWKKKNPSLKIGLTGCMVRKTSTRNTQKEDQDKLLRQIKSLDFVFKITDAIFLEDILQEAEYKPFLEEDKTKNRLEYLKINPIYKETFQAFVPIQIGCDKYCTYCIVPFARGREESRMMGEIFKECDELVKNGCKEITLLGQTVNSYGKSRIDQEKGVFKQYKDPFVELLKRVDSLSEKGLNRLRFSSSHPYDFSDDLINAHKELKTLTPHIHLPIQSGDNEILKKMNRRYTAESYKEIVKKFKKIFPSGSVTTDIIVGFCGETEEQFENTHNLFKDLCFDMVYIARYSERIGTVSEKAFKDDVSREEKARRWHILNEVLGECAIKYNKNLVGEILEVLVEDYDLETEELSGKSRENKLVQFKGDKKLIGTIQKVKINKAFKWFLKGELA